MRLGALARVGALDTMLCPYPYVDSEFCLDGSVKTRAWKCDRTPSFFELINKVLGQIEGRLRTGTNLSASVNC